MAAASKILNSRKTETVVEQPIVIYKSTSDDLLVGMASNDKPSRGAGHDTSAGLVGSDTVLLSGKACDYASVVLPKRGIAFKNPNQSDANDVLMRAQMAHFFDGGEDIDLVALAKVTDRNEQILVSANTAVSINAAPLLKNDGGCRGAALTVHGVVSHTGPAVTYKDGRFNFQSGLAGQVYSFNYTIGNGASEVMATATVYVAGVDTASGNMTLPAGAPALNVYSAVALFGAEGARLGGPETTWLSGTPSSEVIVGSDTHNDRIFDPGGSDTMCGGAGDDVYDVGVGDIIIEEVGMGVDTVVLYANFAYRLPANVENVRIVGTVNADALGNDLHNWIWGNAGRNMLDGLGGNDVMIGGAGRDEFVFGARYGSDTIMDFTPGEDVVRLVDGPADFASLLSVLRNTPNGAVLTMETGDTLCLWETRIEDLGADDFLFEDRKSLDLSGYRMTFSAEFDSTSEPLLLADGGPFSPYLAHWGNLRRFSDNNEQQTYVDPNYESVSYSPFQVHDGMLTISANPTPDALKGDVTTLYISGVLETSGGPYWEGPQPDGFWQQYGYWEMRAQLPAGQGLWPAFWLVGNGEIDIMEALGHDSQTVYQSTHDFRNGEHVSMPVPLNFNYANGFHAYGLQWTPEALRFFIDGVQTLELDGLAYQDFGESFFVVNLAVGGNWAGSPSNLTSFPGEMNIDYIRVYQNDLIA